jgi:hypothetical protein
MPFHDDEASELDPEEFPDPDDGNGDLPTVKCPNCRRPIYEEAERCPYCGHYVTAEDGNGQHPWWLVVGVIACLAVALGWAIWG